MKEEERKRGKGKGGEKRKERGGGNEENKVPQWAQTLGFLLHLPPQGRIARTMCP